jgi:erythromycin esterase-like protein
MGRDTLKRDVCGLAGLKIMFGSQKPPPVVSSIRTAACPLPAARHYDRVLSWLGDASIVLLGESTHGTHDFYAARAALTRRLIDEKDFAAVAIEGDWPDAYRVNRFVQNSAASERPEEVLSGFARFPTWMWRNTAVVEFVAWLHQHNARAANADRRAGFYGLDLYSLHASMRAVVHYLQKTDPAAAHSARQAYACFDHFGEDLDSYAWASRQQGGTSCEEAVARQLMELRERRHELVRREASARSVEEFFSAEQNARLARNAEKYYRTMFQGRVESWNLRDRHMAETLDELRTHLQQHGRAPKIVVWAHNSHVGDARGTEVSARGELNLGQLARERYGDAARLVGFTTYSGTVIAASEWGGLAEVKDVRPALPDSFEDVFHQTGVARFFLPLTGEGAAGSALNEPRLERAIGVIYRPDTERESHYFDANLAAQFDAVIHFDDTHAVEPLEAESQWDATEAPETFPSGV